MSAQSVPLKGSVEAVERYAINPPTMQVDTSGSGNATGLGPMSLS